MPFRVRWTEPSGAKAEEFDSPKAAMNRYVEVLGKGYAKIEVRDDSGARLTPDDLAQLVIVETRDRLNASRS